MRRTGGLVCVAWLIALSGAAACNAVFGIDEVSFGEGGGGASQAPATGTADTTGPGGACGIADLVNDGEFDPGWEEFWSFGDVSAAIELYDDQPLLHVVVDDDVSGGSITNRLDGDDICIGACISGRFSFFAESSFNLDVIVEDEDDLGGTVALALLTEVRDASETLEVVVTEPCRVPLTFTSPDRFSFLPSQGGELLLDDVELIVDARPGDALACDTFSGSGGTGGGGGGGGGDVCEERNWIVGGDFEGGGEAFWDDNDNVTVEAVTVDGDIALHVVALPDVYASTNYDFNGQDELCAGGCVRVSLSAQAVSATDFGIGVRDDQAPFGLTLISSYVVAVTGEFEDIETDPCIIPDELAAPEAFSITFSDGGDLYFDDITMIVDDCPADADICDTFGG